MLNQSAPTQTHLVEYYTLRTHGMNLNLISYEEVCMTCS